MYVCMYQFVFTCTIYHLSRRWWKRLFSSPSRGSSQDKRDLMGDICDDVVLSPTVHHLTFDLALVFAR